MCLRDAYKLQGFKHHIPFDLICKIILQYNNCVNINKIHINIPEQNQKIPLKKDSFMVELQPDLETVEPERYEKIGSD